MFRRILVANRGEIALRIIRACRELNVETVCVFSEEDRNATYLELADQAICIATCRYCYPFRALVRLDPVAVAPVVLRVLKIVVENEQIDIVNNIEIPFPGDVI